MTMMMITREKIEETIIKEAEVVEIKDSPEIIKANQEMQRLRVNKAKNDF